MRFPYRSAITRVTGCIVLCISWSLTLPGTDGPHAGQTPLEYNISYRFRGHAHGVVLLIFPYRVYYESHASVNVIGHRNGAGGIRFTYGGIPHPGYMMRTSGFSGRTLVALAASEDLAAASRVAEEKLRSFDAAVPYYARFIERKKPFLFKVSRNGPEAITFVRNKAGVNRENRENFNIHFQYHPEVLNIDFNIYAILTELLAAFDHPVQFSEQQLSRGFKVSGPLDYTANLNRTVRLAASIMKRLPPFKQERTFRVIYQVVHQDDQYAQVVGEAKPHISIWRNFKLVKYMRSCRWRRQDSLPVHDRITVTIRNEDGEGLDAVMELALIYPSARDK